MPFTGKFWTTENVPCADSNWTEFPSNSAASFIPSQSFPLRCWAGCARHVFRWLRTPRFSFKLGMPQTTSMNEDFSLVFSESMIAFLPTNYRHLLLTDRSRRGLRSARLPEAWFALAKQVDFRSFWFSVFVENGWLITGLLSVLFCLVTFLRNPEIPAS